MKHIITVRDYLGRDGGKRKFIMVQLPEVCEEKSEAAKAGYKNICEIGKERIRRAGVKIKADSPLTTVNLDIGFRVLKLDSSNMKDVYYTPEEFLTMAEKQQNIFGFMDNIKEDGEASGNVNEEDIRRIQIRETISSHFDKEEKLFEQGIKCLSLFFIDEVAKYRQYGDEGEEIFGEYGRIFEEEYTAALNERLTLFPTAYQGYLRGIDTADTHRGYFSIDKKGRAINSTVKRGSDESDDISAYDLILKRKELLLSFEEPTRFIFSHSALREGWDNPNVFQICTLKHSDNATAKRQEVGRGLRLCVNSRGERQNLDVCGETLVQSVNMLTVVASESYAGFVADLQRELKSDLYERPTKASVDYFYGRTVYLTDEEAHTFTIAEATAVYNYLVRNDYVDDEGGVTDAYRIAAETGSFAPLKPEIAPLAESVHKLVQAIFDPSILKEMTGNGHETKVKDNPLNENWTAFKDLWDRINKRYAYTVEFNGDELAKKSIAAIDAELKVARLSYTLTKGAQEGTDFNVERTETKKLDRAHGGLATYDIIGKIAEGTSLTRRTWLCCFWLLHCITIRSENTINMFTPCCIAIRRGR